MKTKAATSAVAFIVSTFSANMLASAQSTDPQAFSQEAAARPCRRTITADVVVLDQPLMFNRLGAQNVNGIIYALRRDVLNTLTGLPLAPGEVALPGRVALRPDKRPRPLVLRVAVGECLQVHFANLLAPVANPTTEPALVNGIPFVLPIDDQVAERFAGFTPRGMQFVNSIADDSSFVGRNPNRLVPPGGRAVYTWRSEAEGAYLVTSDAATFGGEGSYGNGGNGMFAAINVEPRRARFYRSQVTEEEMRLATRGFTPRGQPIVDYEARYPACEPWEQRG